MSGRGELGKQDSTQDGVVIIFESRLAIEHGVLRTAELKESGDLGAPAGEILLGQNRNGLNCRLKDGRIDGFHCDGALTTGFVVCNLLEEFGKRFQLLIVKNF